MELCTDDLLLKTVTGDDISEVARMWAYEEGEISLDEAQNAIVYMQDNHKKNEPGHIYHLCLAVYEKGNHSIIGWCGLDGKPKIIYLFFFLIDKNYRNKGYATQCAEKLISYVFNEVGVPFINGGCDKTNIASFKVMEKIGMEQNAFEENGDPLFYIDPNIYNRMQNK